MRGLSGARRKGLALFAAGLVLLVLSFGVSWATAPDTTTVTAEADVNNTTLVGVQGPGPSGNVTLLDGYGEPRWTYGDAISYLDVSFLADGSVLGTHTVEVTDDCGPYEPPCKRTGVRIIDPEPEPRVVAEWDYPLRTRKDSEVHDAELLPSGELLVADMEWESVFVVNMTTGERRWTWNASEFYDAPPDPTREDWLHINDVDRIGEGRYLVSVRNANQLVVVEEGEGVVEVINDDGDPDVLYEQHNPQWLGDGAVLVADSENDRVVELHRSETGDWEVAWIVTEAGGITLDWPRDADRLPNGNTLITDSRNNRVVEIDRAGDLVASYGVPSLPYEADRVPVGEYADGVEAHPESDVEDPETRRRVPVLSAALAGARHVVSLPYWVSELHVLAASLAVGLWGWSVRYLWS